jgi:hypothetical protein
MSCTIYTMSCKANWKTPLFHIDFVIGVNFLPHLTSYHNITQFLNGNKMDLLYLNNNRQVITSSSRWH